MEPVALLETFHGLDLTPGQLGRQDQAGEYRLAVQEHRTGAAFAQLASVLGAGQGALFPQHLQQGVVAGEGHHAAFAVDS